MLLKVRGKEGNDDWEDSEMLSDPNMLSSCSTHEYFQSNFNSASNILDCFPKVTGKNEQKLHHDTSMSPKMRFLSKDKYVVFD